MSEDYKYLRCDIMTTAQLDRLVRIDIVKPDGTLEGVSYVRGMGGDYVQCSIAQHTTENELNILVRWQPLPPKRPYDLMEMAIALGHLVIPEPEEEPEWD